MAAWGVGSATVPLFVRLAGTRGALLFAGTIVPLVVLLRLRRLAAVDAAATIPAVIVALLRSMPLFRLLPPPALDGVAVTATPLAVPAGETIFQEGEQGDRYYAIADGAVEVTHAGKRVALLARGEGFGEIALLRDGVRTASVTARTDARLLAVEREPFLVAVTGHGATHGRAEEITSQRLASPAQ